MSDGDEIGPDPLLAVEGLDHQTTEEASAVTDHLYEKLDDHHRRHMRMEIRIRWMT